MPAPDVQTEFFRPGSLALDLLAGERAAGLTLGELSGAEKGGSRWSLGAELLLSIPGRSFPLELRMRLHDPGFEQSVEVFVDDRPVAKADLVREGPAHVDLRIHLAAAPARVRARASRWNENGSLVPGDARPIALNLGELRLLHGGLASGKICPMPFTRKEVKGGGPFVPCCSPWLTREYFALSPGEDAWNGEQARALRESVLDGSYRYCRRDLCQTSYHAADDLWLLADARGEFVVTGANRAAVLSGETRMPDGPTAATVTADPRCNLACGSCRSEAIYQLGAAGEERVGRARKELAKMSGSLRRLRIAGDGEPLFSPFLRELIQSLDRERFPALEIVELHTNGLLLDEKVLDGLRPGSDRINRVHVSVDAGDEETYRRVRGGDWAKLQRNLRWVGERRKAGRFQSFVLLFVYRAENFRSMPSFAGIGHELGADAIHFSPVQDWERAGLAYEATAVHLPTHPENGAFLTVRDEVRGLERVTIA